MNKTEIERLIATVLTEHAEKTMNNTDTREELDRLIMGSARQESRRRNGGITIAVAAVAIIAAFLAWWPGVYEPDAVPDPAEPVVIPNAAEQLAADFVTAYASFDRDLMASYVDDNVRTTLGAGYDKDSLMLVNRFDEATDLRLKLDRCYQTATLRPDGAQVGCLISFDSFGSQELGRGPFGDAGFAITIQSGAITRIGRADLWSDWETDIRDPFAAWQAQAHPETALRDAWDDADATEAEVNKSLALWKRHVAEYVAAVKAGEAE